jgi:hypothetical protein
MYISSEKLEEHLCYKYSDNFTKVEVEEDLKDMFNVAEQFIDVSIYLRLLSLIDIIEYDNFKTFFHTCLINYVEDFVEHSKQNTPFDLHQIQNNAFLQLLCILCMQYYFL